MPYTHFQFIAYQTPTFGFDLLPLEPGEFCDAVADIPVPEENISLSADAWKRLLRLAAVVEQAYEHYSVAHQDDTLIIFVAPEFYFRPRYASDSHSYSAEERQEILISLERMFKNAKFRNWLIIPGTIIANTVFEHEQYFYNTAVVIKGGTPGRISVIEKRQPSRIDGVPIIGGIANPEVASGRYKIHYCDWSVRKKRVFRSDGIQFGLDICLDHQGPYVDQDVRGNLFTNDNLRVAKHVARRVNIENGADTSIHILTAGGMKINPESVVAKNGGYVLRSDGGPGSGPNTEMKRADSYTWITHDGERVNTTPFDMYSGNHQIVRDAGGRLVYGFPNCARANLTNVAHITTIPLTGNLLIPSSPPPPPPFPPIYNQELVIFPVIRLP